MPKTIIESEAKLKKNHVSPEVPKSSNGNRQPHYSRNHKQIYQAPPQTTKNRNQNQIQFSTLKAVLTSAQKAKAMPSKQKMLLMNPSKTTKHDNGKSS